MVLIVILCALVVLGTFNTIRIWRDQSPLVLIPPSPEYLASVRYKRFLSAYAATGFIGWSFALIVFPERALHFTRSHFLRALLYIPVAVGWALLVGTLLTLPAIYFNGRPRLLIPPRFRAAASTGWDDQTAVRGSQ